MINSKKTQNELTNLSALVGSIRTNAEAVSKQINGAENVSVLIKGILDMCQIAEVKLSAVRKEVIENSEVKKDV